MEDSVIDYEGNTIRDNYEEEIKRGIIENYLNYRKISEAITKGNTIMEFILGNGNDLRKRWQIQTLYGTKEDGIILLKSSLGEFYVNRNRKRGKIQYLSTKEIEFTENRKRLPEETLEINEKKELTTNETLMKEIQRIKENEENLMEKVMELMEEIREIKRKKRTTTNRKRNNVNMNNEVRCYTCEERENEQQNMRRIRNNNRNNNRNKNSEVICYNCNRKGHIRPHCPDKN